MNWLEANVTVKGKKGMKQGKKKNNP